MSYSVKNYTEQGAAKTIIGGEILIQPSAKIVAEEGATVEGFGNAPYTLPVATDEILGGIKVGDGLSIDADGVLSADGITPAENQAASEATSVELLLADFNALLAKLKAAGFMAADGAIEE